MTYTATYQWIEKPADLPGDYLGEVVIGLPYYGLTLTVLIRRHQGALVVSWPKWGSKYAVRTGSPHATAEWTEAILRAVPDGVA
jgi:hypothetical protein